ncbi:zinc transporter 3-like [Rutidosis leptorrhynchoides]|uniref:zinc transporter 3-like n=1 Tax=Rutidosis leptorrhynchoides TaxID=125765 RepID=UPI003A9A43E3
MTKIDYQKLVFVTFLVLSLISTQVYADCTCDRDEDEGKKSEALKYKLIALVSILVGGAIGVLIPFIGKIVPAFSPEKDGFFVIKAFAAGVILATGFIHILPDAFDSLTSPCLKEHPWGDFPFTGFCAMVATIMTLLFETSSAAYQVRSNQSKLIEKDVVGDEENKVLPRIGQVAAHTHATHGHAHGSMTDGLDGSSSLSQVDRFRIVSKVLELGIIVHSVIIGLSVGASQSPKTIKPLVVALTFHQFFEGIGLGGCIFQAKFKSLAVAIMGAFFSFTTPMGIVIGILVTNSYKENSARALIVEGVLNSASAGILIYMALVDLLSPDFMNPRMQKNKLLQICSNVSLLLGAGLMSLIAKWA